jgi:hypothetical protein
MKFQQTHTKNMSHTTKKTEEELLQELAKLNAEIAKAAATIPSQSSSSTTQSTNNNSKKRKRQQEDATSTIEAPPTKKTTPSKASSTTISAQPVYNPELLAIQKQQYLQDFQIQQQVSRTKQSITSIFDDKGQLNKNKRKKAMRTAAGETWEDPTLLDWSEDDHRIFVGNLGNDVTDEILTKSFSVFPSFQRARVVRDNRTTKSKGYGFVSFSDINDFITAMQTMDGKYIGNRPCTLKKSNWKDRNMS